jgi:hypothetical protein
MAVAQKQVDICVYGGTSAGVIAAYTAKMLGKSVILIESRRHLGGLTTGGLGWTDVGSSSTITGLSRDFYIRVGKHYDKTGPQWTFEPHVATAVYDEYVDEASLDVLFQYRLKAVTKEGNRIISVTLENTPDPNPATDTVIQASMYIDCTYEGDLMAKAGVSYTIGREANSLYDETVNGVQLRDKHQMPDGVDPYVIPGDPSSGLLKGINPLPKQPDGSGDSYVQAYNFRLCFCQAPDMVPVPDPDNYDPDRYELYARYLAKRPTIALNQAFKPDPMPGGKTDWNNQGGFSTDFIGGNWTYPDADYDTRDSIWQAHLDYTLGIFYFLKTDPRAPAGLRDAVAQWGPCKDEYVDNGNWSHQLYIREARRMVGEYVMTERDCRRLRTFPDGIAQGSYTMDSHNCQRVVVNGMVKNEGDVQISPGGAYPISYRSITPKQAECGNLLVPVCLSCTHMAFGSIRMEPVFMMLAQAASTAAFLADRGDLDVQDVDYGKIQMLLAMDLTADSLDFFLNAVILDNDSPEGVAINGNWDPSSATSGFFGADYLHDADSAKGDKSVRFTPDLERAGEYRVLLRWTSHENRATNVPVVINHGDGTETVTVNMQQNGGTWYSLGEFTFAAGQEGYIEISNTGTNGYVIADAVAFLPLMPAFIPEQLTIQTKRPEIMTLRIINGVWNLPVSGDGRSSYALYDLQGRNMLYGFQKENGMPETSIRLPDGMYILVK